MRRFASVYHSSVIVPVFGIVEIIAHFKVGITNWIHMALVSSNIQVKRKASQCRLLDGVAMRTNGFVQLVETTTAMNNMKIVPIVRWTVEDVH